MKKAISRRDFLKVVGVSAAALGMTACGGSSASTSTSTAASSTASSAAAGAGEGKYCLPDGFGCGSDPWSGYGGKTAYFQYQDKGGDRSAGAGHFHCCWHQAEYRYHTGAAKA